MTTAEWDGFAADWDVNDDVREYSEKASSSLTSKVVPVVSDFSKSSVLDLGHRQ